MSKDGLDAPAPVWAQVHARNRVVRYRRSGTGGVVLLLGANDEALQRRMENSLACYGRVLTPEFGAEAPSEAGLVAFIEGVGATRATAIVVDSAMIGPTISIALRDADLVNRVAVLAHGVEPDDPVHARMLAEAPASVPFLLLAQGRPLDETVADLVEFVCAKP